MHPYTSAPPTAFWSRSVAENYSASALASMAEPLVKRGEPVASAGSCFAANLVPYLERAGFSYLRTERRHRALATIPPENLGYDKFSAAYGNLYTARQLLQLLRRSDGRFKPREDRWADAGILIDPFRPGLRYPASSDREFDLLTAQHLRAVRSVFEQAKVFVFTLGLTEAWVSRSDGAVFPACPGTVAGTFDPSAHEFINFCVADVVADLAAFITELRQINPGVRLVLTVSPVPLVATASGKHVLHASIYSKSVLRAAAEEVSRTHEAVSYFPAYEIVTGPQAPKSFFEADRRNVSRAGVAAVMEAFLGACGVCLAAVADVQGGAAEPTPDAPAAQQRLSQAVTEAECEEAMADSQLRELHR